MTRGLYRISVATAVAFLIATAAVAGAAPSPGPPKPLEVGQRVPEFSLSSLTGGQVSYERQIRGKAPVTLFFFMTTACSACYEELKEINDLLARNQTRIDAWCIAVDLRGAQTVAPFAKANNFRVRYLVDPKFSLPRVFGFNYTPSLAVIDAKGVLLYKKGGYSPSEKVSDIIHSFIK
ncbi:MAG TPA: redoxin domain-containing protein [Candidatus Deferrimicrobiaceae bacterium]|jgi:peroxiredoxin